MSDATHRLVQGLVDASFAGEHAIKGKSELQKLYRLDAVRRGATRFESAVSRGLDAPKVPSAMPPAASRRPTVSYAPSRRATNITKLPEAGAQTGGQADVLQPPNEDWPRVAQVSLEVECFQTNSPPAPQTGRVWPSILWSPHRSRTNPVDRALPQLGVSPQLSV